MTLIPDITSVLVSITSNYNIDELAISWELAEPSDPDSEFVLSGHSLDIYRSETPGAGLTQYVLLASGVSSDDASYLDSSISGLYNSNRTWYYKIKIDGELNFDTAGYLNTITLDKIHREIIRRKSIALNQFVGRQLYVIKKKNYGDRCPDCWDSVIQRVGDSRCLTCYGTGFVGGYYSPISISGMINPAPKINQINMFGEWMPSDAILTMLNYPPIKPRDIIVDNTNRRWLVVQIRHLERLGFIIEQNAKLSLISQDDITYDILFTP